MFPLYVINLPKHKKRLINFKQNHTFLSNQFHIFEAFDGYSLSRRQLILENIITEKNNYDPRSLGIMKSHIELWKIAAQSDHGITIAEDDVIIHKDFINTQKKIMNEKKSFDLIAWSYNLDWPIQLETAKGLPTALISYHTEIGNNQVLKTHGQIGAYGKKINQQQFLNSSFHYTFVRTYSFAGLSCYTLSSKGAKYLLSQLPIDLYDIFIISHNRFRIEQSGIDLSLTHFYPKIEAYICSPFLAYSPNEKEE